MAHSRWQLHVMAHIMWTQQTCDPVVAHIQWLAVCVLIATAGPNAYAWECVLSKHPFEHANDHAHCHYYHSDLTESASIIFKPIRKQVKWVVSVHTPFIYLHVRNCFYCMWFHAHVDIHNSKSYLYWLSMHCSPHQSPCWCHDPSQFYQLSLQKLHSHQYTLHSHSEPTLGIRVWLVVSLCYCSWIHSQSQWQRRSFAIEEWLTYERIE